MSDIAKEVSQAVKQARLAQGLTQKQLGERMGVGEPTVNKLESGKKHPTILTLDNVAKALGLKLKITFE